MNTRRNASQEKEHLVNPNSKESVYCIQLKEVLSNSWQGFFEGLEFETLTYEGKEITIMRGSYQSQDEFQKILRKLEEMNLHYQKVTVDTIENKINPENKKNIENKSNPENTTDRFSTHTWIHEFSRGAF